MVSIERYLGLMELSSLTVNCGVGESNWSFAAYLDAQFCTVGLGHTMSPHYRQLWFSNSHLKTSFNWCGGDVHEHTSAGACEYVQCLSQPLITCGFISGIMAVLSPPSPPSLDETIVGLVIDVEAFGDINYGPLAFTGFGIFVIASLPCRPVNRWWVQQ